MNELNVYANSDLVPLGYQPVYEEYAIPDKEACKRLLHVNINNINDPRRQKKLEKVREMIERKQRNARHDQTVLRK